MGPVLMEQGARYYALMKMLYVVNVRMPTEKAHGAQIVKMCEAFARAGTEVELVVPNRHNDITEDPFTYYGIERTFTITRLPVLDLTKWGAAGLFIEVFSFAFSAAFFLPRRTFDILYCRDDIVLYLLSWLGYRKKVWESHDGHYGAIAKRLLAVCPLVVVTSRAAKALYVEHGADAQKILAMPNGIDLQEFSSSVDTTAARRVLGLPTDKKIVLYVGRLDGWKGTDTLLEASKLLAQEILVVIIGGEPPQIETLRPRYPNVVFLGFKPYRELAQNLAAADVLVLPNTGKDDVSVSFTSPLKLFAYMASGKPIVASDLPSIREILPERDGFLVVPDNPAALAQGIQKALSGIPQSATRAERARREVEKYTWQRRAETILANLKSL